MDQTPQEGIAQAAAAAQSLLGQLGPLAWALHVAGPPVGALAVCVDADPERYVEIRTAETESARGARKANAVRARRNLRRRRDGSRTDLFESRAYREAINRSMIVYAVSVMEQFLDAVAEALGIRTEGWPADTLRKLNHLRRQFGLPHGARYVSAGWLVLVRNAVIHNDGVAPRDIADDAGSYGLERRWSVAEDDRGCHGLVWDRDKPVSRSLMAGKRFSIAIDEFILPRLDDAQAFVRDAASALCERIRSANASSDNAQ